jgi:hypothetical protein
MSILASISSVPLIIIFVAWVAVLAASEDQPDPWWDEDE